MFTKLEFKDYPNSFVRETMLPDDMSDDEIKIFGERKLVDESLTNDVSLVSLLYIYSSTPPMGYGTQAPKVAETVTRSYAYNLKKPENKVYNDFDGVEIEKHALAKVRWRFPSQ